MDNKQLTKILVVEDENIVAKDIQNQLKKLRYSVPAVVSSGKEAIQKAEETHPDLVLMDIRLEGDIDGVKAAEQIHARFNIPVIYLTAYADESTLERAKTTEPFGYILKPFQIRQIRSAIEIALYKHQRERKLQERKQWLAAAIKSISDGVIVTDTNGLITFMNPVSEMLTGWRQEDALGKGLGEVFHIINEEARTITENPVKRALQEEIVIGLANNTILIGKDEREIPINVSAAPARDNKGDITGVVLVFREITGSKRAEPKIPKAEKLRSINKKENISIKLMVATSSSLIQEGIHRILEFEKGIEVTAEATSHLEIIPLVEQKKPDVLLIDTAMSNLDVQEILESIKEKSAKTKVLLLLYTLDEEIIINAIYSGARGYLTAALNAAEFTQAIRAVSKDKIWAEIKIITKILTRLFPSKSNRGNLTRREEEIAKLVVQGWSNKKISNKLFITEGTVKIHLNNVFKKLGISNRAQLTSSFL
jgi:PAS domain S-box-containing protein